MIPVIDVGALFQGPSSERNSVDATLAAAARETGFMTVTGLPGSTLAADMRKRLLAIFGLPDTKKRAMCRRSFAPENPNVYRGWFPLQDGYPTYKEGIDIGPDLVRALRHDPADPLTEPTPLPDLPEWREAAAEYYRAMESTGARLMQALACGLGLSETVFDAAFRNGISTLRMIRYPVRRVEELDSALRIGAGYMLGAPHVDSGFVTCWRRTASRVWRSRTAPETGSASRRPKARLWSISASCWSAGPAARCAPPSTAWSAPAWSASLSRSSTSPRSMR
jgi:isopenicillin N synthase-like dioxygenase